ncbi:hypothetical protein LCGC14_0537140 [marine sediment metagenome]|uniref:Uncharacterized protein n=1 Tax=marine sediment metagenome TaxID=412755 RepID=A0A0F9RYP5_9ZZZZ
MSKKTQYPIYFKRDASAYFYILNEKEAIYVSLYGCTAQIAYYILNKDVSQSRYDRITKSEFNKAYKKAEKILQQKFKT